jgi:hypothetical protein
MSHYTDEQAFELILQARHQESKHKACHYRFGQALWNIMSNNITNPMTATDADFFHEKDHGVVIEKLYQYFVIGGRGDES